MYVKIFRKNTFWQIILVNFAKPEIEIVAKISISGFITFFWNLFAKNVMTSGENIKQVNQLMQKYTCHVIKNSVARIFF